MNFQEMILSLLNYWSEYGCVVVQPYDIEKGAGTFNPATFFGSLGTKPCKTVYIEPSRRPADGRYGENPFRLQRYYQMQVIIKPAPENSKEIYLNSLRKLGIDLVEHEVRFVEDDWESPTLGATGLGWEIWLDGLEVTQFTYFQKIAGFELSPISLELTYGLERLAMFLQGVDDIFNLAWAPGVTYGDIHRETERQFSHFNFEEADTKMLAETFNNCEAECYRLLNRKEGDKYAPLVFPAYDYLLRCSHTFNLLDARKAISVVQRTQFILRIRKAAKECAKAYLILHGIEFDRDSKTKARKTDSVKK
ncbi:MAG: glycine--tRNA ligase subunit alpha [Planctomycetota bacterium]